MPDIDTELAAVLRAAKTRPMNFAFVAKGTADGKLLAAKTPIPPKHINDARTHLGGGVVWRGRCFGEEGQLVFEVPKEPPGTLANQLKKVITRDAGLTLHLEVRFNQSLEEEAAEPAPAAAPAPAASGVPTPPPPPPPDPKAAEFAHRLQALAPQYSKAVQAAGAGAGALKDQMAEVTALAHKKDYAGGLAALARLEQLVAAALGPAVPPAPPAKEDAAEAQWKTRLAALTPDLKLALQHNGPLAPEIRELFAHASGLAHTKDFAQALARLGLLEARVRQALGQGPAAPAGAPPDSQAAHFTERLKALLARVAPAVAAGHPAAHDLKLTASEAQALAHQHQFAQANALLDRLEGLLAQPAGPAPHEGGAKELADRLHGLTGRIKEVLAGHGQESARVQTLVQSIREQLQHHDLTRAAAEIEELEKLLASPAAAPPAAAAPPGDGAARGQFDAELQRLWPEVNRYLRAGVGDVGRMRAVLAFAQGKAEEGDVAAGLRSLKTLETLLEAARAAARERDQQDRQDLARGRGERVAYRKALLAWQAARNAALQHVRAVEKAVVAEFPETAEASHRLEEAFEGVDETLAELLETALTADDDAGRGPLYAAILDTIDEYRQRLDDNADALDLLESNPYVNFNVRGTLRSALDEVAGALHA